MFCKTWFAAKNVVCVRPSSWAAEKTVPFESAGCSILCESNVTLAASIKLPILHQDNHSRHRLTGKTIPQGSYINCSEFCGLQKTRQLEFSLRDQKIM